LQNAFNTVHLVLMKWLWDHCVQWSINIF